jgi:trigger factor
VLESEDLPGGPATLEVRVKLVREKVLPDADDAFAGDASEFDTLAELRDDLLSRLSRVKRGRAKLLVRERAIDALVDLVDVEPPEPLIGSEVNRLFSSLVERLKSAKVSLEGYLASTGRDEAALLGELSAQAARQVKADLGLRALAVAESLEVEEADIDEEIVRLASEAHQPPAEVRSTLEREGRIGALRSEVRNAKALAWLVEHVGIVDEEGRPVDRSVLELEDEAGPEQVAAMPDAIGPDAIGPDATGPDAPVPVPDEMAPGGPAAAAGGPSEPPGTSGEAG